MRRRAVVAVAAVALACGAAVVALERAPEAPEAPETGGGVGTAPTPVLSVRRIPSVIARRDGIEAVRADLAQWAATAWGHPCVTVADATGASLLAVRADEPLVPASTLKLVTAAAALEVLGLGHVVATSGARVDELAVRALRDSHDAAAAALLAEARRVDAAGVDAVIASVPGAVVVEGTGHDRANRMTCRGLAELLGLPRVGEELQARLAVAGRSGTLRDLFVGTPLEARLRAKTGSLAGVAGLAGVVEGDHGAFVVAYLVNARPGKALDAERVRADQLALGRILLDWEPDALAGELGPMGAVG